jgi:hypothetical protein
MKMSNETEKKKPALNIFAKVTSADGESKIGSQIGVAWKHSSESQSEGYNIVLDAQPLINPLTGRIEMVAFEPKG